MGKMFFFLGFALLTKETLLLKCNHLPNEQLFSKVSTSRSSKKDLTSDFMFLLNSSTSMSCLSLA